METGRNRFPWNVTNLSFSWHKVILVCFVAILSYGAAKLGGTLIIGPQAEWPLWLGNAFLVSILLLVPRRMWPILSAARFSASVLYNVRTGLTVRLSALLVLSDTVEVLATALCLSFRGCASVKQRKSPGQVFLVRGNPPAFYWSILRRTGRQQKLLDELEGLFFFGGDSIPRLGARHSRLV
jgi:hypothetical protein